MADLDREANLVRELLKFAALARPAQRRCRVGRMVGECGPVASRWASRRTAARSSAVADSSGEGVDQGEGGLRRGSVSPALGLRLLQAEVAVLRGSAGFRGRRSRAPMFPAGCSRVPLVVSATGRWVGRKRLTPAGAARVRGGSLDGTGGHRVDHRAGQTSNGTTSNRRSRRATRAILGRRAGGTSRARGMPAPHELVVRSRHTPFVHMGGGGAAPRPPDGDTARRRAVSDPPPMRPSPGRFASRSMSTGRTPGVR